jgi:hypothetical protein
VCFPMHVSVHISLLSCNCRFRDMHIRFKDSKVVWFPWLWQHMIW